MEKEYELKPTNGRKSFGGKAIVKIADNGSETLYSYHTPVIRRDADGILHRLYAGWTATTGNHVKSFCELAKKDFVAMPVEK